MNRLWVDQKYCKGCLICVDVCPTGALGESGGINAKGYITPVEKDMKQCKACGLCELMCPDFAIAVESDEAADNEADEKRERDKYETGDDTNGI
jgi:2-oxoglutarate ferredoxin oxidoreductase subunit delta